MPLSCTNLSYTYPDAGEPVFTDVGFSVAPGEIVGIKGASGAGKTTLLSCLAGRRVPTAGQVDADGCLPRDGAGINRAYLERVGMVLQLPEQQLFATTVFDEVAFGPRNLGLAEDEVAKRVEEALAFVGMDAAEIGESSPFAHSGGERRRIALASMFALQQRYLLLDEPTAGLDPAARDQLLQSLVRIAAQGVGIVLVSHEQRVLERACARVYDMADWAPTSAEAAGEMPKCEESVVVSAAAGSSTAVPRTQLRAAVQAEDMASKKSSRSKAEGEPVFAFGAYRPGTSFAHRLDPRTKILFCLVFLVACFVANSTASLLVVAAAALAMLYASGTGFKRAARQLRPFVWLMLFVLVFNAIFTASGVELFNLGPLHITEGGLRFGVESVVRFALVLMGSSTLMATTSPTELTDGFALLMRPLAHLGLPVDDYALALQMTLRFIPTVNEEFQRVKSAQEARLANFTAPSPLARAKAYVSVMVPLFTSALRRSETLALAIQNREYGQHPGTQRTCIRPYHLHPHDLICLLVAAAILALSFL